MCIRDSPLRKGDLPWPSPQQVDSGALYGHGVREGCPAAYRCDKLSHTQKGDESEAACGWLSKKVELSPCGAEGRSAKVGTRAGMLENQAYEVVRVHPASRRDSGQSGPLSLSFSLSLSLSLSLLPLLSSSLPFMFISETKTITGDRRARGESPWREGE